MKKKIAPVAVVIILGLLIALWASFGFWGGILSGMGPVGIVFLLAGVAVLGVLIAVLIIRLREIDKEDDDDLKKY